MKLICTVFTHGNLCSNVWIYKVHVHKLLVAILLYMFIQIFMYIFNRVEKKLLPTYYIIIPN